MSSNSSPRSSYSFPAGVKIFTGTGYEYSALEFLSSVHANVCALPVAPRALHISNFLRGRALLWFAAWHADDNYDELRTALLQSFSWSWGAVPTPEQQLRLLQQGFGTVDQYAAEFEHLAHASAESVNAEYNLRWFAWGLRKEIRELVFSEPYAFRSFDALVAVAEDAAVFLRFEARVPRPPQRVGAATRIRRTCAESMRKAKALFFVLKRSPNPSMLGSQAPEVTSFSITSVSEQGAETAETPSPSPKATPSRNRLRSFTSQPEIVSDFGVFGSAGRVSPDAPASASPNASTTKTIPSPTAAARKPS